MKNLVLNPIKNGIVIDHINIESTKIIFDMLKIESNDYISMAMNLKSSKYGLKGIIKVENKKLSENEINKIACLAPKATISVIKDSKVKSKIKSESPAKTVDLFRCKNNKCISNNERNIPSIFHHSQKNKTLIATCYFCERMFEIAELGFNNEGN